MAASGRLDSQRGRILESGPHGTEGHDSGTGLGSDSDRTSQPQSQAAPAVPLVLATIVFTHPPTREDDVCLLWARMTAKLEAAYLLVSVRGRVGSLRGPEIGEPEVEPL